MSLSTFIQSARDAGIPLPQIVDRDSSDSWVYDGSTISSHMFRNVRVDTLDGWSLRDRPYSSWELLHELCHWLVASEDQREFPEFGLAFGIVDPQAWGSDSDGFRKGGKLDWDSCSRVQDGLLPLEEQETQEVVTQMLSIMIGVKWNVSPPFSKGYFSNWKEYEVHKSETDWKRSDVEKCLIRAAEIFDSLVK